MSTKSKSRTLVDDDDDDGENDNTNSKNKLPVSDTIIEEVEEVLLEDDESMVNEDEDDDDEDEDDEDDIEEDNDDDDDRVIVEEEEEILEISKSRKRGRPLIVGNNKNKKTKIIKNDSTKKKFLSSSSSSINTTTTTTSPITASAKKRQKKKKLSLSSSTSIRSKKSISTSTTVLLSDDKKKKLLEDGKRTAKKEFEIRKESIMKRIPNKYKLNFGQIGFTKWNKSLIPVLILSPFQVPPGEVRQTWESMFAKKQKSNALSTMSYLIYWYGALDESSFFGFIAQNSFVPYEKEAAKGDKGCHTLPSRILAKAKAKAPLSLKDKEKYNAYKEMEEDLTKKPADRRRGILQFPEVYDLLEIDDVEDISESSSNDDDNDDDDDDTSSSDDGEELSDVSSVLAEKNNNNTTTGTGTGTAQIPVASTKTDLSGDINKSTENVDKESSDETVQTGKNKGGGDLDDVSDADADDEAGPDNTDNKKKKSGKQLTSKNVGSMKIAKKNKGTISVSDIVVDTKIVTESLIKDSTKKGKKHKSTSNVTNDVKGDSESDGNDVDRNKTLSKKKAKRKKSLILEDDTISVDNDVHGRSKTNTAMEDEGKSKTVEFESSASIIRKKPGRKKKIIMELDNQNEIISIKKTTTTTTTTTGTTTNVSSRGKGIFDKPSVDVDDEQTLFQENEKRHLAKINRWKECIETKDSDSLDVVLSRVVKVISSFTAPFVQAYGILGLIKETENLVANGDEKLKILKANLFLSYAKKKENVPRGFKPILGQVPINPWTENDTIDIVDESTTTGKDKKLKSKSLEGKKSNEEDDEEAEFSDFKQEKRVRVKDEEQLDDNISSKHKKKIKKKSKVQDEDIEDEEEMEDEEEGIAKKKAKNSKKIISKGIKKSKASSKVKRIANDSNDEKEFDNDYENDVEFSGDEESSYDEDNATVKRARSEGNDDDNRKKQSKGPAKVKAEKQMTERGKILKEHISFKASQNKYLPLIEEWKTCLEAQNTKKVLSIIDKAYDVVDDFSASFMEVYGVSNLLKGTKQLFKQRKEDLSTWSTLRDKLKAVYAEKSVLVPRGFAPKLGDQDKIVKFEPRKDNIDSSDRGESKARDTIKSDNIPKSHSSNSLGASADNNKVVVVPAPVSSGSQLSQIVKKSPFSLGRFMKPKENEVKPEQVASIPKSQSNPNMNNNNNRTEKKVVDVIPAWVKDPPTIDKPKDDPRLFALEFLLEMAKTFPDGKINLDSVARSIEIAIFDWATAASSTSTTNGNNSNRSSFGMRKDTESWTQRYWGKIHAIVAAISGKIEAGTLMSLILKGQFDNPEKIVALSEDDLIASFEGRSLSIQ